MSRSVFAYSGVNLGSFTTNDAGSWIPLPTPCQYFGVVLDVSSSLAGGTLEGTISTSSTEVVSLVTTTGPHAFSTGAQFVDRIRFNSSQTSTVSVTAYASAGA